jgi:hypothetical protein
MRRGAIVDFSFARGPQASLQQARNSTRLSIRILSVKRRSAIISPSGSGFCNAAFECLPRRTFTSCALSSLLAQEDDGINALTSVDESGADSLRNGVSGRCVSIPEFSGPTNVTQRQLTNPPRRRNQPAPRQ